MGKVEEVILSGKYDVPTCQNLIKIISNVPGDANCALIFFETIQKVVDNLVGTDLLEGLVRPILRALLRMTIKVPLLFDSAIDFIIHEKSFPPILKDESVYVLSRQYSLSPNHMRAISDRKFRTMI